MWTSSDCCDSQVPLTEGISELKKNQATVDGLEIRLASSYGVYPIIYRVSYISGG